MVTEEFTVDELYELIRTDVEHHTGIDEVLGLLAEYINDKRVIREVDKYIDMYYDMVGLGVKEDE